jgi:hypothetical protein
VNITLNAALINPSNTWFFRYGLSGGSLNYAQDSPVFLSPVVWSEQNSNDVNQYSYFYTTLVNCGSSGTAATLSVIANLVSGTAEESFTWTCPSFTITPLGPSLN